MDGSGGARLRRSGRLGTCPIAQGQKKSNAATVRMALIVFARLAGAHDVGLIVDAFCQEAPVKKHVLHLNIYRESLASARGSLPVTGALDFDKPDFHLIQLPLHATTSWSAGSARSERDRS